MDLDWFPLAFGVVIYVLTYIVPDVDLGSFVRKIRQAR
jgi:hypothetical protein